MEIAHKPERLLPEREALSRVGKKRSAFLVDKAKGLIPPAVALGVRRDGRVSLSAYPESEIEAVVRARIAGATDDEIRELVKELVAKRRELAAASRGRQPVAEQTA
jgi:prophage regulatory protein